MTVQKYKLEGIQKKKTKRIQTYVVNLCINGRHIYSWLI